MVPPVNMLRLLPIAMTALPSVAAYGIPKYGVLPRQAISNGTFAPSTTLSTPASTGSSSTVATITTAPLPKSPKLAPSSTNGTCPASFPADFPQEITSFTEACVSAQRQFIYDAFWYYKDTCLASYCEDQWNNTWYDIMATYSNSPVITTTTRTFFQGISGTGTVITSLSLDIVTVTYTVPPAQLVTLDSPCCGQCRFNDPTIELFWWPTSTADVTPSVTGLPPNATASVTVLPSNAKGIYVDDSGFTFTSPSIYLAFTHLGARDQCGPRGTEIYNTTVGFDLTDISTMLPWVTRGSCTVTGTDYFGAPTTTVRADIITPDPQPLTIADVAQDCSTLPGYSWFASNPSLGGIDAGDPCHPVIALPTKLWELQPEWTNCKPVYGGFYDPPKTLHPGALLVPTTASDPSVATSQPPSSQASPSATNIPTSTPPPPPETSIVPEDPGSSQGDPTSQTPTPNDPQTSAPNNPQTSAPNNPQTSAPNNPQTSAPNNPQTSVPSNPQTSVPNNPQESTPPVDPPVQPSSNQSPPQQSNDPTQGSSTTIIIPGPPSTAAPNPSGPSPPVITLGPEPTGPTGNNPTPGNGNPSNPSPSNGMPSNPSPSNGSPSNPSPSNGSPSNPSPSGGGPSNPSPSNGNPPNPNPPVITLQPTIISPVNPANPSPGNTVIIIGTQTLSPGGVITVGGSTSTLPNGQTTVSGGTQLVLDPQGTQVIVGGTSTINLPPPVTAQPTPVVTVGDQTITVAPSEPIVVAGTTLQPGSTIVVGGTTVSLAPGGTQIVVDGSTIPLPLPNSAQTVPPMVVTVGSSTFTANSLTQFTIGTEVLTGGGTVTVSGTTYQLTTNSDGSTVLIAGTSGVSSAATLSAKTTGTNSLEASTSVATGTGTGTGGVGSSSSGSPTAPAAPGAAADINVQWGCMGVMFALGTWAMMLT